MQGSERGRRNHVTAPDQSATLSLHGNRPHLVKSEGDVISAARIVENVGRLGRAASARIRRPERENALIVDFQKLPIKLGRPRRSAPDPGLAQKTGELATDFFLLFQ